MRLFSGKTYLWVHLCLARNYAKHNIDVVNINLIDDFKSLKFLFKLTKKQNYENEA
jgi:hypothetical protein